MNRDVWGVFHDGYISAIDGTVPGTLKLEITISYLRGMFPEPGNRFLVTLSGCTKFTYCEYDQQPIATLAAIVSQEPAIVYVNTTEPLVLDCTAGTLALEYDRMAVTLESGTAVDEQSLIAAAGNTGMP